MCKRNAFGPSVTLLSLAVFTAHGCSAMFPFDPAFSSTPGACSPFNIYELALELERAHHGSHLPYNGAYAHCTAACLAATCYGAPGGTLFVALYDLVYEDGITDNSRGDIAAEQEGLHIGADGAISCEEGCLEAFPPGEIRPWPPLLPDAG